MDVVYHTYDLCQLSEVQTAAQIALMREDFEGDEERSAYSVQLLAKPAEEMTWDFHELQDVSRPDVPVLQAIHSICTRHGVKEPSALVGAQSILEDGN